MLRSLAHPNTQPRLPSNQSLHPQRQESLLTTLQTSNPSFLDLRTSRLERYGPALFLTSNTTSPPGTAGLAGEVAHFHLHRGLPGAGQPDGSGHVTLSLADADEVVAKGWGQAQMLSGMLGIPLGYTMVYAPRDEQELEVVERIVRAGIRYMSGGKEVK